MIMTARFGLSDSSVRVNHNIIWGRSGSTAPEPIDSGLLRMSAWKSESSPGVVEEGKRSRRHKTDKNDGAGRCCPEATMEGAWADRKNANNEPPTLQSSEFAAENSTNPPPSSARFSPQRDAGLNQRLRHRSLGDAALMGPGRLEWPGGTGSPLPRTGVRWGPQRPPPPRQC